MEFLTPLIDLCVRAGGKLVMALLIFIIGRIVIKKLLKTIQTSKGMKNLDPTVQSFAANFAKIALYVILAISVISVLGVPMSSVIALLTSASVAVGLAMQGSLSNLAGGIMLLIFRPFNVGDYISAAGEEGTAKEITLFYTILITVDNKTVTIPNGTLMNANVVNFSTQATRRVDLTFSCAKGENIRQVQDIMIDVMKKNPLVLQDPAPFAQLSGGTNEAMEFTVRAWTETANYWDTYFQLLQQTAEALGAAGIQAPAVRVITETK